MWIPGFVVVSSVILIVLMKILHNKNFLLSFFFVSYFLLLLFNLNQIPTFVGDEKRYRISVESMMDGKVDTNNHPLFAKSIWLIIVNFFFIVTGTDMPVFWRFGTVLFSLLTLLVFYKISRLFFTRNISLIAVVLLAVDPMFFVFSRSLQLEVIMLFWVLTSIYFYLRYLREGEEKYIFWGSLFLGISLSSKLSALVIAIIIPLFLFYFKYKKKIRTYIYNILKCYVLTALSFFTGNIFFLIFEKNLEYFLRFAWALVSEPFTLKVQTEVFQTSSPETWFFIPQLLSMYRLNFVDSVNSIVAFQNPVTFTVSAFSIIGTFIVVCNKNIKNKKELGLILIYFAGLYFPWFFNLRETYYYYILPTTPLIILMFINLAVNTRYSKILIGSVLTISTLIFALYFPILTGIKVPKAYDLMLYKYSQYDYPEINRLFCQNCYPRK